MCLRTIHENIRISTGNITVYKVLSIGNYPPYFSIDFSPDSPDTYRYKYGSNLPYGSRDIDGFGTYNLVYGGFLHAFMSKSSAVLFKETIEENRKKKYKVVKMTIPPGAAYWVGDSDDICASELYWESPWSKLVKLFKKK